MWTNTTTNYFMTGADFMIYVGIDIAKDKHDCHIFSTNGEIDEISFTFSNDLDGFKELLNAIPTDNFEMVRVGLEATGHYSFNLVEFLMNNSIEPIIFNPLQINLIRKAQSLRKTKTDKVDAKTIAFLLLDKNLNHHSNSSYHFSELKSLARHRFRLVKRSSEHKVQMNRLVVIMFPELDKLVNSVTQKSVLELLRQFPSKEEIANAHLTRLTTVLKKNSRNRYGKDKAIEIRNAARQSIGSSTKSFSFELKQTIEVLIFIENLIKDVDNEIREIMDLLMTPITTVPGISYTLGSMILSEIGDVNRFDNPGQILAFAGLEPGIHQSGTFDGSKMKMVKRGSPHLRWALFNASSLIVLHDETFKQYYEKKQSEGKHHLVIISHVARKLVRVLFKLLRDNIPYERQIA